jgi:hypothetical protein
MRKGSFRQNYPFPYMKEAWAGVAKFRWANFPQLIPYNIIPRSQYS